MNNTAAAAALALLTVTISNPSGAADPPKSAKIDWSGIYVGAQAGYARGESFGGAYFRASNALDVGGAVDPDGFFGGIYFGYSHQIGNSLLLGIESDLNYADIRSGVQPTNYTGNTLKSEMTWNGSVRATAGYDLDSFLLFVTAGYAFGSYEFTPSYGATGPLPESKVHDGWTIGAGINYAWSEQISTRIEYRYADYGKAAYGIPGFPAEETRVSLTTSDVRVGVSYKFR